METISFADRENPKECLPAVSRKLTRSDGLGLLTPDFQIRPTQKYLFLHWLFQKCCQALGGLFASLAASSFSNRPELQASVCRAKEWGPPSSVSVFSPSLSDRQSAKEDSVFLCVTVWTF